MRKISKVYVKIFALFLVLIVIVSAILGFSFSWYSKQNVLSFQEQIKQNMSVSSQKVVSAWESIHSTFYSAMEMPLFYENLLPTNMLTVEMRFYQTYLSLYLNQMKIQLSTIVDSIFVLSDEERIIYHDGITSANYFFTNIVNYRTYEKAFWTDILHSKKNGYFILDDDKYITSKINDVHHVIPLIYVTKNQGHRCVFVINLSCDSILKQYYENAVFDKSIYIAISNDAIVVGNPNIPIDMSIIRENEVITTNNDKYYVNTSSLNLLGWRIACLTPVSEFLNVNRYFSFNTIAILSGFVIIGIGISLLFSRIIYDPIRHVSKSISRFVDSNEWGNNEFDYIENNIKALATDRAKYLLKSKNFAQRYISQELMAVIDNNQVIENDLLWQLLKEHYQVSSSFFRCINLVFDFQENDVYNKHYNIVQDFQSAVERYNSCFSVVIPIKYHKNMMVFVLNETSCDNTELVYDLCTKFVGSIAQDEDLFSIRIGIGGVQDDVLKIKDSFMQANTALFSLLPDRNESISVYVESSIGQHYYDRKIISNAIMSRDINKIQAVVEDELNTCKREKVEYSIVCKILNDIYDICQEVMSAIRIEIGVNSTRKVEKIDYITILLSTEIDLTPLISFILKTIGSYKSPGTNKKDETASRIKDFIDQNFRNEISLDIISDNIGISAKYISRVFKNEYGMNLIDYIQYKRVEIIKEMLLTKMSIEKISESVGINNRTTFNRTFRAVTGISPGEYRRLNNMS